MARTGHGQDAGIPPGVLAAGAEAWRIGALLEREAGAGRVAVPDGLKAFAMDLQTASARIEAAGLRPPFPGDALKAVPPAALRSAMAEARRGGLLTAGAEWTLAPERLEVAAEALRRTMQRHLQMDLQVSEPHLGGGGRC